MAVWFTVFIAVFVTVVSNNSASKISQLGSVFRKGADGVKLVQMGTSFNSSILKLVGHAFVNLEETVVHDLCQKIHVRCDLTEQSAQQTEHMHLDFKHTCANVGTIVMMHVPKTDRSP